MSMKNRGPQFELNHQGTKQPSQEPTWDRTGLGAQASRRSAHVPLASRRPGPAGPPRRTALYGCGLAAVCLLALLAMLAARPGRLSSSSKSAIRNPQSAIEVNYARLPLAFEANQGQADSAVKFVSRGSGYTLFLTGTEAVLALNQPQRTQRDAPMERWRPAGPGGFSQLLTPPGAGKMPALHKQATLRMRLVGANPNAEVRGLEELPGKSNYFIGNDPAKWQTNVPNYAKVEYRDVYPGVNLVYYGNGQQLEHDFVVAPGADPSAIRFAIEGADKLEVDAQGDLVLHAGGSEARLRKPLVYQEVDGERREVAGGCALGARNPHSEIRNPKSEEVDFTVAAYDPTLPLVIDPVLVYSTYLNAGIFFGSAIAVDSSGNAYVCGDNTIKKISADGSALVYSTAIWHAYCNGIAVDASGSAYVTGVTWLGFPTVSPLQATYGGGDWDAFVAKLNPAGSALVYSTYLGGSGTDYGLGIAVDSSGNAYVTGDTDSTNFPTASPLQATLGGPEDAFVTKLNAAGSALVYSTYLGGGGYDYGDGIAVDGSGNAYVTGGTTSPNFPTASPVQATKGGFGWSAFVTKLNAAGSALIYSTYLGGSDDDDGYGIAVDPSGNAYVTGGTYSANFPTVSPLQATLGGPKDAFVTKLNATGSALLYSTYLGGSGNDRGSGIAVDSSGNAYVTGETDSTNFPMASPLQATHGGGNWDAFVAKLNAAGSALVYSTYLGGTGGDYGNGIAVDGSGNAYVTGSTSSSDFPTVNPLQANGESFVAKVRGPNDNFADAVAIAALPFTDTMDTTTATTETSDPTPTCSGSRNNSVWYKYTPAANGTVIADTFGSSYDTILSAWTGSPGSFTQVACNDDTGGQQSQVGLSLTAGTTYYFMVSTGGTGGTLVFHLAANPTPAITSLSPTHAPSGSSALTLTIIGTGFNAMSVVRWNGSDRTTTLQSATSLSATIPAGDLAAAGTAQVTVFNPAPGGGTSNALTFTIDASPTPAITSLSPNSAAAGTNSPLQVTITGTGFTLVSVVRWNGQDRATSYNSSTQLWFVIPTSDLTSTGTAQITVYNPPTGGGLSNAATFTIGNPAPTLTALSVTAGNRLDTGIAITLTGTKFISGVTSLNLPAGITVNAAGPFTVVNSTTATVTVDIGVTAATGANSITVANASPGGGTSTAQTFTVSNPAPTLVGLSVTAGNRLDTGVAITLTGAKFISGVTSLDLPAGITVNAGGPFTVANSTTATVTVDIGATAATGANNITVTNAAPGGGTSGAQAFTVGNPVPTLTALSVTAGNRLDTGIAITLTGTKFISGVTSLNLPAGITVNAAGPFTVVNAASATVTLDIGATAATGANNITVTNAAPGGGTSGAQTFTVSNPAPALTALSVTAGNRLDTGIALTLTGTKFISGVTGINLPAGMTLNAGGPFTVVNSTTATVTVDIGATAATGANNITVTNAALGGGTSAAQTFTVSNPGPAISSLSPPSAVAGGAAFTLTVNGSNLVSGAVVRWNGTDRTTTFVSSTQLTASIAAADIAAAGTPQVTVFTPAPGGGTSPAAAFTINNPVPSISSLSPSTVVVGGAAFTLTVNGSNFVSGAVVRWNGSDRTSAFVSENQLRAEIPASDIATIAPVSVTVFNPSPGGGTSNAMGFTINNPVPTLSSLSPASVAVGGPGFVLTVTGSGFAPGVVVRWNGSDRTTTFRTSTQLEASIPAGDISTVGSAQVTAFNPSPGGGLSNAIGFTIGNPMPAIVTLSPSTAVVGGAGFTLNVNGANFIPGSVVRWNGADRTTIFVTTSLLQTSISSGDIAAAGDAQVTVFNPSPGGGTSLALTFTVSNPAPGITSLSPSSATAGGAAFTLTVNGSNFVNGAVVRWNGSDRTTAFVSATQLTTSIAAADIAAAGTAQVTVFNPAPGGGTSNALPFTINPPPAASVVKVSGDGQSGQVGTTLGSPLVVEVRDGQGAPLAGVTVNFAVTGGGASPSPATGLTGANGRAQTVVTLGTTATAITITASVTGVAAPAVFTLTAVPGLPASLSIVLGNNQAVVAGTTLPTPLIVKLTDVHGNAVPGATVNFEVTGGGGSLSASSATTGANGQAQVIWTLGGVPGPNSAKASMGTLGPVVFQATGLSGGVPVGSITVENATGSPGGTARVRVTLNLNSGFSVDSLSFGIGVAPNGAAPALTDDLSFVAATGMPPSPLTPTGPGPGLISVSWLSLPAALSGTVRLGEVVVPIPALATEGQTYRVRVTGVSVSLGMVGLAALPGPDMTLSMGVRSYLVGDAFPLGSDLNGDSDKDDVGEFGDSTLEILDLVYALRAVTSVPGYRPPACSDRFDAIDSHPADTPTVRGGNGTLNTVDLIYTLRRVTNVDPSRPRRYTRNIQPCTAGAGPELVAQAMPSGEPAARLELGLPQAAEGGAVRIPVYLEAARDLELAGLSFSIGMTGLQPGTWNLERGTAPPPTLVDPDVPGVLSIAWLEGLQVAVGQRLLLGYVVVPGLAPGTDGLRFVGVSASAPDGSEVRVSPPAPREQM